MDCYNRCLCITCLNNEDCRDGCNMCQQLTACRFIIARSKCGNYKPDKKAVVAKILDTSEEDQQ